MELIHALYASDGVGGQGRGESIQDKIISALIAYANNYRSHVERHWRLFHNVQYEHCQDAQAIALHTGGNNQGLYSSSLLGWQDTTLVNKGTQFFVRCYIEGAVDFIYGLSANAWFVSRYPSQSKKSAT